MIQPRLKTCRTEFIREVGGEIYLEHRVVPFANEFAPTESTIASVSACWADPTAFSFN